MVSCVITGVSWITPSTRLMRLITEPPALREQARSLLQLALGNYDR